MAQIVIIDQIECADANLREERLPKLSPLVPIPDKEGFRVTHKIKQSIAHIMHQDYRLFRSDIN